MRDFNKVDVVSPINCQQRVQQKLTTTTTVNGIQPYANTS